MQDVVLILIATGVIGILCTRAVRQLALKLDLVDRPDGHRKIHQKPIPLGGGVSIYLTTLLVIAGMALLGHSWWSILVARSRDLAGILTSATLIVLLGAIDDAHGLRGRQKLFGQLMAALVVIANGIVIERVQLFNWVLELGWLSVPLTLFWLLGAINALNLLDGIDGLATSIGMILTAAIAAMASVGGHPEVAVLGVIFVGAQFGVFRYNFPPASIYLGDAGSMLIGLVLGTLAIQASLKGPGTVLLAAPMAALAIPIFDSGAAILRRKLAGRSIYSTDRGHLHHVLSERVGSRKALGLISLACVFTSVGALFSAYWRNDFVALISVLALTAVFITTRIFGHSELLLLFAQLRRFGWSLMEMHGRSPSNSQVAAVHMQGRLPWTLLWQTLTEWADELSLQAIRLDVNVPTLHEAYNATWSASRQSESNRQWQIRMPLVVANRPAGYLDIVGDRDSGSATQNLERLLDLLDSFEAQMNEIVAPPAAVAKTETNSAETSGVSAHVLKHGPHGALRSAKLNP
ncbi:MAG: MraY family glycosyltransferase [Planctomycetaceae bacterium]